MPRGPTIFTPAALKLAPVAVLIAIAGILFVSQNAFAQHPERTGIVRVSNLGQEISAGAISGIGHEGSNNWVHAISFRTGNYPAGYALSEIQVDAYVSIGSPTPRITIYSDNSNRPGSGLFALTSPADLNGAVDTFTAPAGTILQANHWYWLLFEVTSTSGEYKVRSTGKKEDPGFSEGWTIGDTRLTLEVSENIWGASSDSASRLAIFTEPLCGECTNVVLERTVPPAELLLTWDPADPLPTDYRIDIAKAGENFTSWRVDERHAYPPGTATSVAFASDLAAGADYKVRMRARYYRGVYQNAPWSGPWVHSIPVEAPATEDTSDTDVTPAAEPEPDPRGVVPGLTVVSERKGELLIHWDEPAEPAGLPPDRYRIMWVEADRPWSDHKIEGGKYGGSHFHNGVRDEYTRLLMGIVFGNWIVTEGIRYKVQVRALYPSFGNDGLPWSGPWTEPQEAVVSATNTVPRHSATKVGFAASTYTIAESGDTADVSVRLDRAPGAQLTIPIVVRNRGGATSVDYSGVPGSLTFGADETSKSFTVTAVDDSDDDDDESMELRFQNLPYGMRVRDGLGPDDVISTVISITDNDDIDTHQSDAAENTAAVGAPTVAGTPAVGETLSAVTTGISDADGLENVVFAHQWLADNVAIDGGTNSAYTVADADTGKTISVQVTFTDDAGNRESLTSAATAAVAAAGLQLLSATVDGAVLTLNFNESLDEFVSLPLTAFSVSVNDATGTVSGASVWSSTVTLTLVSAAVAGDTVTVDYTKPDGEDFIRDNRGRVAATFSGREVTNGTAAAEPEEQATALTASVHSVPGSHDGSNVFTFELRFSEEPEPDFSYTTLRDHAFTVTGGEVDGARRLEPPGNIRWEIKIRPDSAGTVTIVLPVTSDCAANGAICTGDGRMLSNRSEFTVTAVSSHASREMTINAIGPNEQSHHVNADTLKGPPLTLPLPLTPMVQRESGGVCNRTRQVKERLMAAADVDDCSSVTAAQLAAIDYLDLNDKGITTLQAGDFAGLTTLRWLYLENNELTLDSFPGGMFRSLPLSIRAIGVQGNPGCPTHGKSCFPPSPTLIVGEGAPGDLVVRTGDTVALSFVLEGYRDPLGRSLDHSWGQESGPTVDLATSPGKAVFLVPHQSAEATAKFALTTTAPSGRWNRGILGNFWESEVVTETAELTFSPPPVTSDTSLSELTINGINPRYDVSAGTYEITVINTVGAVTVDAKASDRNASVVISPADTGGGEGHQVAVNSGANTITITATATDGMTTQIYNVIVTREAGGGVCSRTQQVKEALMKAADVDDCSLVTAAQLAAITSLHLNDKGITTLQAHDFAGLTTLWLLNLKNNELTLDSFPGGMFRSLPLSIRYIDVAGNPGCPTHGTGCFPPSPTVIVGEGAPGDLLLQTGDLVELSYLLEGYRDPLGRSLTHSWGQKSGPSVNLSNSSGVAVFRVPHQTAAENAVFTLTTTSRSGRWSVRIRDTFWGLKVASETAELTFAPPLPAPGMLRAEAGVGVVTLSWSTPPDGGTAIIEYQYRQKSGTGTFGDWTNMPGSGPATTSHTLLRLTNGAHAFQVRAVSAHGKGHPSSEASATLTSGDSIIAVPVSPTEIRLSWTGRDEVDGTPVTGYRIEVINRQDETWTSIVANTGNIDTTRLITDLVPATLYNLRVRALGGSVVSVPSRAVRVTTPALQDCPPPRAPEYGSW